LKKKTKRKKAANLARKKPLMCFRIRKRASQPGDHTKSWPRGAEAGVGAAPQRNRRLVPKVTASTEPMVTMKRPRLATSLWKLRPTNLRRNTRRLPTKPPRPLKHHKPSRVRVVRRAADVAGRVGTNGANRQSLICCVRVRRFLCRLPRNQ